jgi:hypothetical protein
MATRSHLTRRPSLIRDAANADGCLLRSAIIVKLYVREATSPDAIRLVGAYAAPYVLTQWQELEVKNAIRLKAFRVEITSAEMKQSIAAFEQDIATGRWQRPAYTAATVEQKADDLSPLFSRPELVSAREVIGLGNH